MSEAIGKYRILHRIGRGGMGLVFKAHDPVLDRLVAIKLVSADLEVNDEVRTRFFREAFACAQLSHPNIVTIYDMGEDDGRLYIVMEFLEGVELSRLIKQRDALTVDTVISIMAQVCDGLHYAHGKGIVHRDVKPGNILLLPSGDVKIVDFGIARIAATGGLTRTGVLMGTLRYMAPEQMWGRADERSDIFSIGSVFYELLTGRPPFDGDNAMEVMDQIRAAEPPRLTEVDPTIPSDVAAIVTRAMQRDPDDRFNDLEQMRMSLEEVQRRRAGPEPRPAPHASGTAAPPSPAIEATVSAGGDGRPDVVAPPRRPRRRPVHARAWALCAVAVGVAWLMAWGPPQALRLPRRGDRDSGERAPVADFAGRIPLRPAGDAAGGAAPAPRDARGRDNGYAHDEVGASVVPAKRARSDAPAPTSAGRPRRAPDRGAGPAATSRKPAGAEAAPRADTDAGRAHTTVPGAEAPRADAEQVAKDAARTKQAESELAGRSRGRTGTPAPAPTPPPGARKTEPSDAALPSRPVPSSQAPASRAVRWRHGRSSCCGGSPRSARVPGRRHGRAS